MVVLGHSVEFLTMGLFFLPWDVDTSFYGPGSRPQTALEVIPQKGDWLRPVSEFGFLLIEFQADRGQLRFELVLGDCSLGFGAVY